MIVKIDDVSKGAIHIAKEFLIRELAIMFVVQTSRSGDKKILKETHPNFVKCITSKSRIIN